MALCSFSLVVWMRVLENSWEVVQSWSKVKKIYPQNFLPVTAAQEEKFKLVEEILLLCGSTNVYGLILETESLPAARALIVCNYYKHKLLCVIEAPYFLVLSCKWNKSFPDYASFLPGLLFFLLALIVQGAYCYRLLPTNIYVPVAHTFWCVLSCLWLFNWVVWIFNINSCFLQNCLSMWPLWRC